MGASEVEPRRSGARRDRGDPSGGRPTTPSQPGPAIGAGIRGSTQVSTAGNGCRVHPGVRDDHAVMTRETYSPWERKRELAHEVAGFQDSDRRASNTRATSGNRDVFLCVIAAGQAGFAQRTTGGRSGAAHTPAVPSAPAVRPPSPQAIAPCPPILRRAFVNGYCAGCHDERVKSGGMTLTGRSHVMHDASRRDYRFSAVILDLVKSAPFQMSRAETPLVAGRWTSLHQSSPVLSREALRSDAIA